MLVLSQQDLIELLDPLQIINAVEAALRALTAQRIVMPKRLHMDWRDNTLLAMPAAGENSCGVKIVSVVPGNSARGLPVTNGLMILNDGSTGLSLALMNAGALTAQRTGAVGALGVKYMTPEDTGSVGVIGSGVQGAWQAICACAIRPIKEVFCFSRSGASFEQFAGTVERHTKAVRVTACRDVRELLERTSLVITATTSAQPVLPDEPAVLENKHFISVGSFRPCMQELPDSVYRLAGSIAVDSQHAAHEVGDVMNALERKLVPPEAVFSIAECVTGQRTIDITRTSVYKTVGAALYDLYVAEAFYQFAKRRGIGSSIEV